MLYLLSMCIRYGYVSEAKFLNPQSFYDPLSACIAGKLLLLLSPDLSKFSVPILCLYHTKMELAFPKLILITFMLFATMEAVASSHPPVPNTASNAIGPADNQVGAACGNTSPAPSNGDNAPHDFHQTPSGNTAVSATTTAGQIDVIASSDNIEQGSLTAKNVHAFEARHWARSYGHTVLGNSGDLGSIGTNQVSTAHSGSSPQAEARGFGRGSNPQCSQNRCDRP